jgi:CBS domain containing-hemolysin-like protein
MTWLLVAGIFVLIAINGFFVASEFALVRARRGRLEEMARGTRADALVQQELDEINEYLSACQLGITLASIGIGFLGEPAVARIVEPLFPESVSHGVALAISLAISYAITTALHITIGEQVPKILAITRAEETALRIARPLHFFARAFGPPVRALNAVSNWILRLLGVDPNAEFEEGGSPAELRRLIAESGAGGILPATQAEMLGGVFHLEEQQARHVMTPGPELTTIRIGATAAGAARICVESGHTRLVVVDESGAVAGVLHANSILDTIVSRGPDAPIADAVAEPLMVPETRPLPELLRELRNAHVSLAIVVDEYGRTAGIVTIEDVIEEIVGEIADETDRESDAVRYLGDNQWVVAGHVSLADLEAYGAEIPAESDAFTSVGGLVFHLAGRVPQPGEEFETDGYRLRVEEVDNNRVARVRITHVDHSADPQAPAG